MVALLGLGMLLLPVISLAADAPQPAVVVLNRGIGGDSTADGLRRFQRDVLAVRPAHLILYFGMNDALNSSKLVPPEQFAANLQAMITQARQAGIGNLYLVTLNPIIAPYVKERHPDHPAADLQAHLAHYDALIRETAKRNRVPLADLRRLVEQQGGANERPSCLIRNEANSGARDGIHLTAEGYRRMADLIAPLLRERIHPGETVLCFGDSITYGAHMRGAGTILGDTYPAWLSFRLNRMLAQ